MTLHNNESVVRYLTEINGFSLHLTDKVVKYDSVNETTISKTIFNSSIQEILS